MIDLNHKHLILKGVMTDILTVSEVENVINDLVDKLGMKYVKAMPVNPWQLMNQMKIVELPE